MYVWGLYIQYLLYTVQYNVVGNICTYVCTNVCTCVGMYVHIHIMSCMRTYSHTSVFWYSLTSEWKNNWKKNPEAMKRAIVKNNTRIKEQSKKLGGQIKVGVSSFIHTRHINLD